MIYMPEFSGAFWTDWLDAAIVMTACAANPIMCMGIRAQVIKNANAITIRAAPPAHFDSLRIPTFVLSYFEMRCGEVCPIHLSLPKGLRKIFTLN